MNPLPIGRTFGHASIQRNQKKERMLLRHLRNITGSGILERHQEDGMPLRVRYSLTPYGLTLVPVSDVLCTWGREHLKREPF